MISWVTGARKNLTFTNRLKACRRFLRRFEYVGELRRKSSGEAAGQ
jgi:hypothetical protein